MMDEMLSRLRAVDHARASGDAGPKAAGIEPRPKRGAGDPLPLVARALALMLAVSVSSLTLATTNLLIN